MRETYYKIKSKRTYHFLPSKTHTETQPNPFRKRRNNKIKYAFCPPRGNFDKESNCIKNKQLLFFIYRK